MKQTTKTDVSVLPQTNLGCLDLGIKPSNINASLAPVPVVKIKVNGLDYD